jgi:hypothetical protein
MAFEFPSTITARKEKKKVEKKKKEKEISKMLSPLMEKKGMKGEIASMQLEDVFRTKDTEKIIKDKAKLKKIVDAIADDKQLERTERKMSRDVFKGGGRAMYKSGTRGCKLAMKGKGRAYGKNS